MKASSIIATTIAAVSCSSVNGFTRKWQDISTYLLLLRMIANLCWINCFHSVLFLEKTVSNTNFSCIRTNKYIRQYSKYYIHQNIASIQSQQRSVTTLFAQDDFSSIPVVERGVSVDQDGKSNVWAIEPKVEVDSRSSEEKGQSALIAGGGLAAVTVFAALVLLNLPDPNQF
jgi:hypothetical protein